MVLPIGKKIRFLATSNDVIHAWWVPELGIKRDSIPGFINETTVTIQKAGTYRGQCAELCGVLHGFMPIVVEAKSEEEFNSWLQTQTTASAQNAVPMIPSTETPTTVPSLTPTTPDPTTAPSPTTPVPSPTTAPSPATAAPNPTTPQTTGTTQDTQNAETEAATANSPTTAKESKTP